MPTHQFSKYTWAFLHIPDSLLELKSTTIYRNAMNCENSRQWNNRAMQLEKLFSHLFITTRKFEQCLKCHIFGILQGQAVVQLAKTVADVTIFGVCSKSKHEELKAAGTIDHLLERGSDYSNEVRK